MKKKTIIIISIIGVFILIGLISVGIYAKNRYYYDETELYKEINYTAPKNFEKYDEDDNYYFYYDDDINCNLTVDADDKEYEENLKSWFEKNIHVSLNEKVGELKEIQIANKTGYYIEIQTEHGIEYHYGVESSNYYYELEYDINDSLNGDRADIDTHTCYTSKDKIIESVEVK